MCRSRIVAVPVSSLSKDVRRANKHYQRHFFVISNLRLVFLTPAGPLAPSSIIWCTENTAKASNAPTDPCNDMWQQCDSKLLLSFIHCTHILFPGFVCKCCVNDLFSCILNDIFPFSERILKKPTSYV